MAVNPPVVAIAPAQTIAYPKDLSRIQVSGEPMPKDSDKAQDEQNFMDLARERFKMASDAEADQRREMLTDLEFYCGDQWDPQIRNVREGGQFKRPCLTINRIPGFVKHVVNNMRQSRPAISVIPVGDSDEELAEVEQGLIRHVQVNSQSDIASDTAFEHMAIMGIGWMRIVDDWASADSFDQELFVRWVPNPFTVYRDPFAQQPDWSDGKFLFNVRDLGPQEFVSQFGSDKLACSATNFNSIGDHAKYWYVNGNIRVAEYFTVDYEDDWLCEVAPGDNRLLSTLPKGMYEIGKNQFGEDRTFMKSDEEGPSTDVGRARATRIPQVWWNLIDGLERLKRRKWKGTSIPFVPIIGTQIDLDGKQVIVGMVRFLREPQRLYNYMYSCLVETAALAPRSQFIAEVDQIDEFRDAWERANTDPQGVLVYRMKVDEMSQEVAPPPQRQSASPDIAAFVQGIQVADAQMKAVCGIFEASLGQRGPQESGIAINARKIESETATFDWGDNFIRALQDLGRKLLELLEPVYNTPGRVMQVLQEDETRKPVVLNKEHTGPDGQIKKYDLSKSRSACEVSTGPSYPTKRKESVNGMIEFFKLYPAGLQACAHILVDKMDFPGKDVLKAQLEKILPPNLQEPDPNAPPIPPALQAQFAQMQAMIQQLSQALETATNKNIQEQIKQQWATLREQMKDETSLANTAMQTGSTEAQFLATQIFDELKYIRQQLAAATSQPGAPAGAAAPQAVPPPAAPAPIPQPA